MKNNNVSNEEWRDIEGYEGLYKINSHGVVYSIPRIYIGGFGCKRQTGGELIPILNAGYYSVKLCRDGACKGFKVHRLLAIAFLPNPNNYPVINHIDGNKLNNSLDNLEWCTISHNMQHAYDTGLKKPSRFISDEQIDWSNKLKVIYLKLKKGDQKAIAQSIGLNLKTVSQIIKGRSGFLKNQIAIYNEAIKLIAS